MEDVFDCVGDRFERFEESLICGFGEFEKVIYDNLYAVRDASCRRILGIFVMNELY